MLVAKGYPDLGWNPIEGERYLSFLRFAVFCNGRSDFCKSMPFFLNKMYLNVTRVIFSHKGPLRTSLICCPVVPLFKERVWRKTPMW